MIKCSECGLGTAINRPIRRCIVRSATGKVALLDATPLGWFFLYQALDPGSARQP